jgi:hypothetical protein
MRACLAMALLAALFAACGRSPRAGRTPKETIRNFEAALRDADMGAVFDMMSAGQQAELEASLAPVKALLAAVPESQLKEAGLAGVHKMGAREMLITACEKAEDENAKALDPIRKVTIVVTDVRQSGDRATVKASILVRGRAAEETIPLVREGGVWKIDGQEPMSRLPVPTVPALPECGPSP